MPQNKSSEKEKNSFWKWLVSREARHFLTVFEVFVACSLLGLSLDHLASGIERETSEGWLKALLLAIGIDLGIIGAELALVLAKVKRYKGVVAPAWVVLGLMFVLSAVLNARSYTFEKPLWTFSWWLGIVFGGVIPITVFSLAKITAGLVIGETGELTIRTEEEKKEAWRVAGRFRREQAKKETTVR